MGLVFLECEIVCELQKMIKLGEGGLLNDEETEVTVCELKQVAKKLFFLFFQTFTIFYTTSIRLMMQYQMFLLNFKLTTNVFEPKVQLI